MTSDRRKLEELLVSAESSLDSAGSLRSSALVCLDDAKRLEREGFLRDAGRRALDSLRYSVGVFSPVYTRASETLEELDR